MIYKTLTAALAATFLATVAAHAAPISQNSGDDDCYNRVTHQCNRDPGGDWGDAAYRKCIKEGIDRCDIEEPVSGIGGNRAFRAIGRANSFGMQVTRNQSTPSTQDWLTRTPVHSGVATTAPIGSTNRRSDQHVPMTTNRLHNTYSRSRNP